MTKLAKLFRFIDVWCAIWIPVNVALCFWPPMHWLNAASAAFLAGLWIFSWVIRKAVL